MISLVTFGTHIAYGEHKNRSKKQQMGMLLIVVLIVHIFNVFCDRLRRNHVFNAVMNVSWFL